MKKKLLFVIPSLNAGGGEKSLINLLYQLDYELYDVDLFLFNKSGVFLNSLPEGINILNCSHNYNTFTRGVIQSVMNFLAKGQVTLAYSRLIFTILNRVIKNTAASEQYSWKYRSKSLNILKKEYDAAIGYLEKSSIYFVVDKVKAKRKIGWIHTNYSNSGMDREFDYPYFKQLDHIVTVSNECANSLKENFHSLEDKIKVIYNIVSPNTISKLANQILSTIFDPEYLNIVTVARLSIEKGIDLALKSCRMLLDKGYKVKWYVIGDGNERVNLEFMIERANLKDSFILLGIMANPYPYMRDADIYVQPSRYEGKSIAIDEAKILKKPIVVTNYETVKDQIYHKVNGIITPTSVEGLSNGIETILNDPDLKDMLVKTLNKEILSTENEIKKLYEIIN